MMKRLTDSNVVRGMCVFAAAALALFAHSAPAQAAAPPLLPLQGNLTDSDGVPVEGPTQLTFAIYDSSAADTPLWLEAQSVMMTEGYFVAYMGDVEPLPLSMFRDDDTLWLGIQVESDPEMARVQLATTPYSGYAEYCGNIPDHSHALADLSGLLPSAALPASVALGQQSCSDPTTDKVVGIDAMGQLVCAADMDTDTDTTYTAGAGLLLSGGEFSADPAVITDWAGAACYDTVDELRADLDSVYAPVAHSHELADLPGELADGDDDTLAELACTEGQLARMGTGGWECVDANADGIGSGMFPRGSVPILYGEARDWIQNNWNYKPFASYASDIGSTNTSIHGYLDQVRYAGIDGNWVELFGGDNYGNGNDNRAWAAAAVFIANPTASAITKQICFTVSSSSYNENYASIALNGSNLWSNSSNNIWSNLCMSVTFPATTSSVLVVKSGVYNWTDWNGQWGRVTVGFRDGSLDLSGTELQFDYQRYQDYIANR